MSSLSAITIGNFDGVHQGHAALVRAARSAVGPDGRVTALCFEPHPLTVLNPPAAPARLTTFARRTELLMSLGADEVVRIEPSPAFLAMTAREFVAWMTDRYRPSHVVEGRDFRFGQGRAGTVRTLRELDGEFGFETIIVEPVEAITCDGLRVRASSSMLRWLLGHGRVRDAAAILGRPYELAGPVVRGDQRGRAIGVPTANLDHGEVLLPGDGVYAGQGELEDGTAYAAAISIGRKPTFDLSQRTCEAHLIDFPGPIGEYGWTLRLRFGDWLRDQLAFRDVGALVDQVRRDIGRAARYGAPGILT
jgi:riboflavin kinase/FMN adenylyltransferase